MSTLQSTPHATHTARSPRPLLIAIMCALIAIGATALILAATGTGRSNPTASHCAYVQQDHRCIWVP